MSESDQYEQVNFQASQELRNRLDEQADTERTDRSTICRKALDYYCDEGDE